MYTMKSLSLVGLLCLALNTVATNIRYSNIATNSSAVAFQALTRQYASHKTYSPDPDLSAHLSMFFPLTVLAIVTGLSIAEFNFLANTTDRHVRSDKLQSPDDLVNNTVKQHETTSAASASLSTTSGIKRRWGSVDSSWPRPDLETRSKRRKIASFQHSDEPNQRRQSDSQPQVHDFEGQEGGKKSSTIAIESIMSSVLHFLQPARVTKRNGFLEPPGDDQHDAILKREANTIAREQSVDTRRDCLHNLVQYIMATDDDGITDHEVWKAVTRHSFFKASRFISTATSLNYHLAILARHYTLQQILYYTKTICRSFQSCFLKESIFRLSQPSWIPDRTQQKIHHTANIIELKDLSTNLLFDQDNPCNAIIEASDYEEAGFWWLRNSEGVADDVGEYDISSMLDWEAMHSSQGEREGQTFDQIESPCNIECWSERVPTSSYSGQQGVLKAATEGMHILSSEVNLLPDDEIQGERQNVRTNLDVLHLAETSCPKEHLNSTYMADCLTELSNKPVIMGRNINCPSGQEDDESEWKGDTQENLGNESWTSSSRNTSVNVPFVSLDNTEHKYGTFNGELPFPQLDEVLSPYHGSFPNTSSHKFGSLNNFGEFAMDLVKTQDVDGTKNDHNEIFGRRSPLAIPLPASDSPPRKHCWFKCTYCAVEFPRQCDLK